MMLVKALDRVTWFLCEKVVTKIDLLLHSRDLIFTIDIQTVNYYTARADLFLKYIYQDILYVVAMYYIHDCTFPS